MHSWLLWSLLACLLVLPVLLALVGDEPPDNAIRHESGEDGERDPEPPLLAARA